MEGIGQLLMKSSTHQILHYLTIKGNPRYTEAITSRIPVIIYAKSRQVGKYWGNSSKLMESIGQLLMKVVLSFL